MKSREHMCGVMWSVLAALGLLWHGPLGCSSAEKTAPTQDESAAFESAVEEEPAASGEGADKPNESVRPKESAKPKPVAKSAAKERDARADRAGPVRGLFVTRWDFRSPMDVERIVEQAKGAGFTDLYWQVRGQCDAFYAGAIEPWGEVIAGTGVGLGEGPGFDPLGEAVRSAHDNGMRIHAWMNTLTLWHGAAAPASEAHVRVLHPQWRLTGADGGAVRTRDGYELLNPALPEVLAHLEAVTADLCGRYAVDGVCFDVLRLPVGAGLPGDGVSRRLFVEENAEALGSGADRARVAREWMSGRLTLLAMGLAETARSERPGVDVSFVTIAATPAAAEQQSQLCAGWLSAGICDELIVLQASESATVARDVEGAWRDAQPEGKKGTRVIPAILPVTQSDPAVLGEQLRGAGKNGPVAVFGYAALFESVDGAVSRDSRSTALRTGRREAVTKVLNPKALKPADATSLNAARGVPTEEKKADKKAETKKAAKKGADDADEVNPAKPEEDERAKDSEEQDKAEDAKGPAEEDKGKGDDDSDPKGTVR